MAQNNDDPYNYDDPQDIQAAQYQQYGKEQDSGNATVRALSNIRYGLNLAAGGGPEVAKASAIKQQMTKILQQTQGQEGDNEDPITTQMRLAQNMSTGMATLSPDIAMKANTQMLKLQQARTQQGLLEARTAQEKQTTDLGAMKVEAAKAGANYTVFDTAPGADGLPSMANYGDPISMYKSDGSLDPEFHQKLAQAVQDAKDKGAKSPVFMPTRDYVNGKGMVADTRAKAQIEANNARIAAKASAAGNLTQDGLAELAGNHLLQGATALARIDPATRISVLNFEAASGLTPLDGAMAQTEIKGVNSAAVGVGRREANIKILATSLPGLGKQVFDTLDQVDRTRFPLINSALIAGRDATGNPQERQYSVAIQGLITDYARVISGATGVTTDAAREQAHELISKADSPAAVKAAVHQMVDKETQVINEAAPQALELLANPSSYPHASKIMTHLGFQSIAGSLDSPAPSAPAAAPTGGKRVYNPATGKIE